MDESVDAPLQGEDEDDGDVEWRNLCRIELYAE